MGTAGADIISLHQGHFMLFCRRAIGNAHADHAAADDEDVFVLVHVTVKISSIRCISFLEKVIRPPLALDSS